MGTEALVRLLSGTTMLAPHLGRASLTILMGIRLAALVGARSLWHEETSDLVCNSTTICRLACFDSTFPVSPFTLFLLQMAFVSAHGLACFFLGGPPDCQGKGWLRNETQQLQLHFLIVLARILLEGIFLVTFHVLYARYPQTLHCPPSPLCTNTVVCTIHYAQWKDTFNLFIVGISWASVGVCIVVLYHAITEILQLTLWPAKRQLGRPLLVVCA